MNRTFTRKRISQHRSIQSSNRVPSQIIENILNYSRTTWIRRSENIGSVEMNLN